MTHHSSPGRCPNHNKHSTREQPGGDVAEGERKTLEQQGRVGKTRPARPQGLSARFAGSKVSVQKNT